MKNQISSSMSNEWYAWINMMLPGPPSLHVTGSVDVGNGSDSATLVFDSLEKKNPPNLVLRIEPQTIFIPRDPGDTIIRLHYFQPASPGQYDKIIILYPNGDTVEIEHISIAH